jgi:hypothetical protein
MTCQGRQVFRGPIPFVSIKSVAGVDLVQFDHQPVSKYLCDDGCGCNAGTATVTADNATLGDEQAWNAKRVNQREVRERRQGGDSVAHRPERCVMNIGPINGVPVAKAYRPRQTDTENLIVETVARRRA